MTDQAESGASTVESVCEELVCCRCIQLLKADLERVTAELTEAKGLADNAFTELQRANIERDALHVAMLKVEELASRPSVADETRMGMIWRIVVDALAHSDATRKAAADAENEDRDVETARQMLREFDEVEG